MIQNKPMYVAINNQVMCDVPVSAASVRLRRLAQHSIVNEVLDSDSAVDDEGVVVHPQGCTEVESAGIEENISHGIHLDEVAPLVVSSIRSS